MEPPATNGEPRIAPWRAACAFVVIVALTFLSIGYHDGAFGVESVTATDLVEGTYRFKGTVEDWDGGNHTFVLRDDTGAREFLWNITVPRLGETYVVDAEVGGEGDWQALALTRILLVEGTWV